MATLTDTALFLGAVAASALSISSGLARRAASAKKAEEAQSSGGRAERREGGAAVTGSYDAFPVARMEDLFPVERRFPSPIQRRPWPLNNNFVGKREMVLRAQFIDSHPAAKLPPSQAFQRAGPWEDLYWDPAEVKAAVVTCGGLCPGLNNVVREVVMCLWYTYGVRSIYGVQWGYRGFYEYEMKPLTPRDVSHIHLEGGSVLGSSRGGFDQAKMVAEIKRQGINQIYTIGGDGTHRGARALCQALVAAGVRCAVAAIPKTIDRDIPIFDTTFGFETAVARAVKHIHCAHTEAITNPRGVGIVKLMGRQSGFIALHATLASRDVNLCLIPEAPYTVEGVCDLLRERLRERDHAVIVIAEGAAPSFREKPKPAADATAAAAGGGGGGGGAGGAEAAAAPAKKVEKDESGNVKLDDVGELLVKEIEKNFKATGEEICIKYIDPSYMIRSVACDSADSVFCTRLAFDAVHGVMAGLTEFSTGTVDGVGVWVPVTEIADRPPRLVDVEGREYALMCRSTGQTRVL